jgi:cell division control protein 45
MSCHSLYQEYDLTNLSYTGFIRVTGYKSTISASDMSHAITALLECETKATQSNPQEREEENEDLSSPSVEELEEQALMSSFNIAYDALNSNGSSSVEGGASVIHGEGSDMSNLVNGGKVTGNTGLGAGIRLAMAMQRAIITTATSLVERNAICRLSHFRYAYLHATSQGVNGGSNFSNQTSGNKLRESGQQMTHHIFAKPLALTRLAHFLMDMHRSDNKWSGTRARPLVLLSEKPETQTYLVAGYEYAEERGVTEKNTFGQKFELATKTMQGTFKFDAFDSNVVEVKSSDVQKFIEHLHYMIDSI